MNVTWQGVEYFEDSVDGRALLKEIGGGAEGTGPLPASAHHGGARDLGAAAGRRLDGFRRLRQHRRPVGAIEHQLYGVPFVNLDCGREDSGAGKSAPGDVDTAAFRKRLWNATMNGQSPTYANTGTGAQYANAPGAKQMTVWYDFFSTTRATGNWSRTSTWTAAGRLALEDTEYVVYVEKPGPLELVVEKHGYDVYWVNPIDGQFTKGKEVQGRPLHRRAARCKSHDWVLHVVREGARGRHEQVLQVRIARHRAAGNGVEQPQGAVHHRAAGGAISTFGCRRRSPPRSPRNARHAQSMMWLWTGEVAADGQGYRVLGHRAEGRDAAAGGIAKNFPAVMHLRVYGMNANGKVYAMDRAFGLNQ
jgi:hypothetical protein